MNKPCFTETSFNHCDASRSLVRYRLDTTRGAPHKLHAGPALGQTLSMLQGSPARQGMPVPGTILLETLQGLLLGVVHVEDQRELGHHEDVLDLLVHRGELHLRPPLGVARVAADQHAQRDAVHEGGVPEIDEELLVSRLRQLANLGLELVRLLAPEKHPLGGENRDVPHRSDIQTHRFPPSPRLLAAIRACPYFLTAPLLLAASPLGASAAFAAPPFGASAGFAPFTAFAASYFRM